MLKNAIWFPEPGPDPGMGLGRAASAVTTGARGGRRMVPTRAAASSASCSMHCYERILPASKGDVMSKEQCTVPH